MDKNGLVSDTMNEKLLIFCLNEKIFLRFLLSEFNGNVITDGAENIV